jgi:hypothetical protein
MMWWWNGYGPGPWGFGPLFMVNNDSHLRSPHGFS